MKTFTSVLLISLFAVNYLIAQPTEKLTNSIIVKMVKAKLSDDLIIGEINSSEVDFDLNDEAINQLKSENVSSLVLQAMTEASEKQTSSVTEESNPQPISVQPEKIVVPATEATVEKELSLVIEPVSSPEPPPTPVQTLPLPEEPQHEIKFVTTVDQSDRDSTLSVESTGFVIPLRELILYFDQEFSSFSGSIQKWDQQIRNTIETGRQIKNGIREIDANLTDKKNANSKGFSTEIAGLKNQLLVEREKYQQFKRRMLAEGMSITKELKEIGSEMDRSIENKFSEVGNKVRSSDSDPSVEITKPLTLTKQVIDTEMVNYIAPANEMLVFCQNEILSLKDIMLKWNEEVRTITMKDKELKVQLDPLNKEMINYQLDSKKNKKEISVLKKQCSELEKERKGLDQQMGKKSKELSKYLDVICKEVQGAVKDRYADIINHIDYLYQDNLTEI